MSGWSSIFPSFSFALPVRGNDFSLSLSLSLPFHLFCQSKELIDHFQTFSGPTRSTALGAAVEESARPPQCARATWVRGPCRRARRRELKVEGVERLSLSLSLRLPSAGEDQEYHDVDATDGFSRTDLCERKRHESPLRLRRHTCSRSRCRCIMEQERRQRPTKIWKADLNCETEKNLGPISHAIKRNRILSVTHGRPT